MVKKLRFIPLGVNTTDYRRSPCLYVGCEQPITHVYQAEVYNADPTMSRFLPVTENVRRMINDSTINPEAIYLNKNGKNILSIFTCKIHIDESEKVLEKLGKPKGLEFKLSFEK